MNISIFWSKFSFDNIIRICYVFYGVYICGIKMYDIEDNERVGFFNYSVIC